MQSAWSTDQSNLAHADSDKIFSWCDPKLSPVPDLVQYWKWLKSFLYLFGQLFTIIFGFAKQLFSIVCSGDYLVRRLIVFGLTEPLVSIVCLLILHLWLFDRFWPIIQPIVWLFAVSPNKYPWLVAQLLLAYCLACCSIVLSLIKQMSLIGRLIALGILFGLSLNRFRPVRVNRSWLSALQTVSGSRKNLSPGNRLRICIWSFTRIMLDHLATTRSSIFGKLLAL